MNAVVTDVRSEALFVSNLQRSQRPTPELIREAVTTIVDRLGEARCAPLPDLARQTFHSMPNITPPGRPVVNWGK